MKNEIINSIQHQIKPHLNQNQYIQLNRILKNEFKDIQITTTKNTQHLNNKELLTLFLKAKKTEGCSPKTIHHYKKILEKILKEINKRIEDITTDDLRNYLTTYKEENNLSKTTIDNMRRILSSFFTWLEEEDYILKNPVKRIHRIKKGIVVKETLTDENIETIIDNCENKRDRAIIELLLSTGIRVGELVKLNKNDINFQERECLVQGKGGSERIVYFNARCKIHLKQYLNTRNDNNPALFVSLNRPHKRLGINGVEVRLKKIGEKSDIPNLHPHKFRRTLATQAIDKGMPIEQVQKLLGHVKIDTTMHYAIVNQNNVKIAHRKYLG
ncbi:MAG: tyrosine-type recombinase/integrase [Methanobrevibacter sp.]|uniref:site-specific tyrosine recombinase/integron integrase n=1 Tax=Methanobrevibacter sp. TaxID=66852 RepID=UPI003742D242|nr:tyrosine-type recombinase/integrase [Methanobrevibacter sp.]